MTQNTFVPHGMTSEKLAISGFNNLTKVLSFNMYDFCIALTEEEKLQYVNEISQKYNATRITQISEEICRIIDANILGVSKQDYEPVGASTMVLMSDLKGGGWQSQGASTQMHLDKSHICVHTYPDASDPRGICSFRVDLDIATCGEIIPLNAINFLFKAFDCDVVVIDYVVRGYTRLDDGRKIYSDHKFNSIQDFIDPEILKNYDHRSDMNLEHANTWQTKLMVKNSGPERYLYNPQDINNPEVPAKMKILTDEMKEVFHLIN